MRASAPIAAGLLLLAACAPDDTGDPPRLWATDDGPDIRTVELEALSDADVQDLLFSGEQIPQFRIELDSSARGRLREEPFTKVEGTFVWGDLRYEGVGVRLKGNGSFRRFDLKPSWRVEFDSFADGQDFFGIDTLVLNNMISDDSKIKERVAYRMYREAGVPAARASHSVLFMNEEPYGLYTHMEDVDERMLAPWFADPDGPLFELFDAVLSPDAVLNDANLQHESGPPVRTQLVGAANALALDDRAEQLEAVAEYVEMDAFLRYYAVTGYIGHFDGWPMNDPGDDVHLYVEPHTQRIHPIPHGLDESFRQFFRHMEIPGGSLLAQACYFTDDCRAALDRELWEVHQRANDIDLAGYAHEVAHQVQPLIFLDDRDETTSNDALLLQDVIVEFLLLRRERLEENAGPE